MSSPPVLLWQVQSPRSSAEVELLQLTHRHLGCGMHHGRALHARTPVPWQQRGGRDLQDLSGAGNAEAGEPSQQVSQVIVTPSLTPLKYQFSPCCFCFVTYWISFTVQKVKKNICNFVFNTVTNSQVTHLLCPLVFLHVSRTGLRATTWPPRWTSASQSVSPPAWNPWSPVPAARRSHWWRTCYSGTPRKGRVLCRYI